MIYLMDTERDLDKGSGVAADIPFFRVESAEQERLAVDEFNEQRINGSNGVSDGRIGGREGLMMRTGSEEARVYPELDSGELQSRNEVRVSEEGLPGLHFNRENDDSAAANVETEKGGSYGTGVSSEITSKEADGDNGATVSDVKSEGLSGNVNNDVFAVQNSGVKDLTTKADVGPVVASGETKWDPMAIKEQIVSDFNSQYTMFNAGQMPEALGAETLKASGCGLEMGDMVWGKVKSHPWWPGHIYTEAFASPSVRRTRREGHVLVAFFGDSSYGWFDPSELIPFDPHYAEKSRQTSSRNFVKAAEESVDEASRRSALGLTCRCRNPFNFRPTKVRGYFAVDVDGFEPGGIYSLKQIKQARDSFRPAETLSFIQQLAVTPRNGDHTSIAWIKNIAAVFAYRKAVFEEFDETYAQAFGVQPVRPSRDIMALWEQYAKVPSRAPLSGPLVIAEALGERKISTKPGKIKEHSKKDKYLFKRRDEPTDHRAHHIDHSQLSKCRRDGIRVPAVYAVDENAGWLMLEWISGGPVRAAINTCLGKRTEGIEDDVDLKDLMRRMGTAIGKMHQVGIVHGDLTTSNIMLNPAPGSDKLLDGEVVIIDLGLASGSISDEDRAVDLYVLERAFGSTHPRAECVFLELLEAYRVIFKHAPIVLKKLEDVRMRGRKRSMLG